ncbi:argininosuccinate lyase [Psychroflexus montanilacus]|uniref:argininosuccinate lyase n=1 Tax=Psychroflexus montanilacus TaxID=2873598 RepID=UPI001CCF10E4|nr:argininosuccinate lyase [Psychroflexus montanilacus]MBZ9650762.1 argininosuccinate lyase [Psychroflexus montanilacus]
MKLWDKGIDIDKKIEQFTVGNDREIDMHIAQYDVMASQAHAKMLESVGLISSEELQLLLKEFEAMEQQLEQGTFIIDPQFEDVHSKIEFDLIQNLGDVGKKIHTARSRNDQVLVALHLYYKEQLLEIRSKVRQFFDTLLALAETHKDQVLPGYTHLQVAMPSSFGLWFSAYAEQLIDDVHVLDAAIKVVDQNPLGSAAGYGSSFPIDREFTTKALGFSTMKYNVVAAQMSRGKSERTVAMALGSLSNTLSRFAMDICLYMSQNFDFIGFPDQLTTGSSIMPHKKNPDVFELIRGKCNKIQALPSEMILITNNLPSGYHRDYQLLKENMMSGIENMTSILEIFNYSINQIQVKSIEESDPKYKFMYSVDKINALVEQGISFREAYQQIGQQINAGSYQPGSTKTHTHEGSMGNLCLDQIKAKFPK